MARINCERRSREVNSMVGWGRGTTDKGGEHDWNLVQQMRKAVDSVVTVNCK